MSAECEPPHQVADLEQFETNTDVTSPVPATQLLEQDVDIQGRGSLIVQSLELARSVGVAEASIHDTLLDEKPVVFPVFQENSNFLCVHQDKSNEAARQGPSQGLHSKEGQLRELLVMGFSEIHEPAKETNTSTVNASYEQFSVNTHNSIPNSMYSSQEDCSRPVDLHTEGPAAIMSAVAIKLEENELPRPKKIRHKKRVNGKNVCLVCGDKALAHNFGVITCESCKAFFRRNALKLQSVQKCMFHNRCVIDKNTRRFCPSCRLKKCFDIGMKADLILDEEERRLRQEKKNLRIKRQAASSSTSADGEIPGDVQVGSSSRPGVAELSDNSSTLSPDSAGSLAFSPSSRTPSASVSFHQVSPLPSIHTLRESVESPQAAALGQASPMYSQPPTYAIPSPAAAGPSLSDSSSLKGIMADWAVALPSLLPQSLVSSNVGQQSPLHFARKVLSKALSITTSPAEAALAQRQDGEVREEEKRLDELPFPLPGPAARLFHHVALDQLPSDPFMYWLVSAEERLVLANLTTAYQDVLLTLSERGLYRNVPLCDTYFLHDFLNEIDDAMYRIVQFSKHIADFRLVGKEDQIAMLKASAMQTLGIACCAVYVSERDCWLSLRGDLTLTHLRTLTNDDPYIQTGVEYCRSVKSLAKNDFTIYALIHCMILFDPRDAKIVDRQLINQTRDKYVIMLKHYLESQYSYLFADEYFVAIQERVREMCHLAQSGNAFYKRYSSAFQPLIAEMLSAT